MDAFETAARAEAARRWHSTVTGRIRQIDFVAGAEWVRAHLAAQEPSGAEVEAGKAVLEFAGLRAFDGHLPGLSERLARKVLTAAHAARRDEETR